jgi:hypothetical protein
MPPSIPPNILQNAFGVHLGNCPQCAQSYVAVPSSSAPCASGVALHAAVVGGLGQLAEPAPLPPPG